MLHDLSLYPLQNYLESLLEEFRDLDEGALADYIPELAKADPGWFGLSLATVDGHVYQAGDSQVPFTIQSISKPFTYGLALDLKDLDSVLAKVGVEPSGEAFNEISLEEVSGRPFNPMINAGAIATTGLVQGESVEERFGKIIQTYEKYSAHSLSMDESVYRSESDTGNRNRAIAYLLRNSNIIEDHTEETLDLYFRQCSIQVTCRDLAVMGATLANNGINPITGVRALKSQNVEKVLSIMSTCGMYDYAGGWIYHVGMPAKSGVAGGIMAVLPGQFGIGVFSPRLDRLGNSVRGIKVCEQLSRDFGLHMFDSSKASNAVIRARYDATRINSSRSRSPAEEEMLQEQGRRIRVIELAGELIFNSTDFVLQTVIEDIGSTDYLIFDFKRVSGAKRSACKLLSGLIKVCHEHDKRIFFININYQISRLLKQLLPREVIDDIARFNDSDALDYALEWCENDLLGKLLQDNDGHLSQLDEQVLLQGFTTEELEKLAGMMTLKTYAKGETIVQEGDDSASLFFILEGNVSVMVKGGKQGSEQRIATLTAGHSFGEMSLIDHQHRSASIRALSAVTCYELSFDTYENTIRTGYPAVKDKLLNNIIVDLADKIRRLNREIKAYQ